MGGVTGLEPGPTRATRRGIRTIPRIPVVNDGARGPERGAGCRPGNTSLVRRAVGQHGPVDTADVIGLVSLAVATVLGLCAIAAARRWGNPRGRLLFDHDATSLVPGTSSASDLIAVIFRGLEVSEPHLVAVRLVNVGPRDIASATFAGAPRCASTSTAPCTAS